MSLLLKLRILLIDRTRHKLVIAADIVLAFRVSPVAVTIFQISP